MLCLVSLLLEITIPDMLKVCVCVHERERETEQRDALSMPNVFVIIIKGKLIRCLSGISSTVLSAL